MEQLRTHLDLCPPPFQPWDVNSGFFRLLAKTKEQLSCHRGHCASRSGCARGPSHRNNGTGDRQFYTSPAMVTVPRKCTSSDHMKAASPAAPDPRALQSRQHRWRRLFTFPPPIVATSGKSHKTRDLIRSLCLRAFVWPSCEFPLCIAPRSGAPQNIAGLVSRGSLRSPCATTASPAPRSSLSLWFSLSRRRRVSGGPPCG